jgi:hypothetical protein
VMWARQVAFSTGLTWCDRASFLCAGGLSDWTQRARSLDSQPIPFLTDHNIELVDRCPNLHDLVARKLWMNG